MSIVGMRSVGHRWLRLAMVVLVVATSSPAAVGWAQASLTIDWQSNVPPTLATSLPKRIALVDAPLLQGAPFDCHAVFVPSAGEVWLLSTTHVVLGAPDGVSRVDLYRCGKGAAGRLPAFIGPNGERKNLQTGTQAQDATLFSYDFAQDAPGTYMLTVQSTATTLTTAVTVAQYTGPRIQLDVPEPGQNLRVLYTDFPAADKVAVGLYRQEDGAGDLAAQLRLIDTWAVERNTNVTTQQEALSTAQGDVDGAYWLMACTGDCAPTWNGFTLDGPHVVAQPFTLAKPSLAAAAAQPSRRAAALPTPAPALAVRTIAWQTTIPATTATNFPPIIQLTKNATEAAPLHCPQVLAPEARAVWLLSAQQIILGGPPSASRLYLHKCGNEAGAPPSIVGPAGAQEPFLADANAPASNTFYYDFAQADVGVYTATVPSAETSLAKTITVEQGDGPSIQLDASARQQDVGPDESITVQYAGFRTGDKLTVGLYRKLIRYAAPAGELNLISTWPVAIGAAPNAQRAEIRVTAETPGGTYWLMACANDCPALWDEHTRGGPQLFAQSFAVNNPVRTVEIGYSVRDEPIEVTQLGNGPRHIVLVGGLHAGFAPATVTLARQAIDTWTAQVAEIPADITLHIIPNANPDSPKAPGQLEGRLNDHRVDLNRNWDCAWKQTAEWRGQPINGGAGSFSEPETAALYDYLMRFSPIAVVFWEAKVAGGMASPGGCGPTSRVSEALSELYGQAAGYKAEAFTAYAVNGDAANSLDQRDMPAIAVLLPDYSNADWPNNQKAIQALLAQARK